MSTLTALIETETQLWAHCETYDPVCNRSALLNLDSLAQRFGPDFNIVDGRRQLRQRLVCSKCGARFPSLSIIPTRVGGNYA